MTKQEYEALPLNEKQHFIACPKCGAIFDRRSLDEVLFHTDHRQRPDIQYSGSEKVRLLVFLLFASAVSVSAVTLTPSPTGAQSVFYAQGEAMMISPRRSVATITVCPEVNGHVVLLIGGRNQSTGNINFGTENVSAYANEKPLRVFTYDDLEKKIKSDAFWKGMAFAAGGGVRAGVASQPARTTYSGRFNGSSDYGPYQGNYFGQTTTTDRAAQAMAQSAIISDSRAQGAALNAERDQRLAALSYILRTTTVQPGQRYGGIVEIARPPASSVMSVRVSFAGEGHVFSFRVAR